MRQFIYLTLLFLSICATFIPAFAEDKSRLQQWRDMRQQREDGRAKILGETPANVIVEHFGGREFLIHVPENLPHKGSRAMVVVLHGGTGNANHIHSIIGMDDVADKNGFIIAYLNGSPAMKRTDEKFKAWNAGGECCGQPYKTNVDDVGYITKTVSYLSSKYGIDRKKVFGIGHSNGAMMASRLLCETDVFQAGVPISGPLNIDVQSCPAAKGARILAIHGAQDKNVPIEGGFGMQGVTNINYKSEQYAKEIFIRSGAEYKINNLAGVDHSLERIDTTLKSRGGYGIAETAARFFGLSP